uniref:Hexosyltransferase n=1 Tax=Plectus sambesii TaxID=2011161 RepID=A0A914WTP0_9BILA
MLKSDSDTVVNIPAMEKLCSKTKSLSILGSCGASWPIRDPGSKWFTPTWVWPGIYPKFCLGSAYMLVGQNAAKQLLAHVNKTNFFRSSNFRKMGEDVVWTGIVAEKAQINRTHTVGFSSGSSANFHCFADGEKAALTVHYIKGLRSVIERWKFVRKPRKC